VFSNIKLRSIAIFFILALGATFPSYSEELQLKGSQVLMLVNADPGFPFWESTIDYAKFTAEALNFELEVVYVPIEFRDRFNIVEFAISTIDQLDSKPALVISAFWMGAERLLLEAIEENHIPVSFL